MMYESLLSFFSFQDINIRFVTFGTVLIGISSGIVGVFAFLRKRSLTSDTVSHSLLPGIVIAFMLSGSKNPIYLLTGAFIGGFLSILITDFITRNSKIKPDTANALTLSVMFGFGIMLLTSIQNSGNAAQAGLDHFLFGKAAAIASEDLMIFIITNLVILTIVFVFYRAFKTVCFSRHFAIASGFHVKFYETLLSVLLVLTITVGIQSVGVVLTSALLITPAAAGRFISDRLHIVIFFAAIIGAIGGLVGSFISFIAPGMPTGAWIVLTVTFIAILTFYFSPKGGIAYIWYHRRKQHNKILLENLLKVIFSRGEAPSRQGMLSLEEIMDKKFDKKSAVKSALQKLQKKNLLSIQNDAYVLTPSGRAEGIRLTRLHRLWELYLTRYVKMAPDHVHDSAEAIEHIITPEIEKELEILLDFPKEDPHNKEIPY